MGTTYVRFAILVPARKRKLMMTEEQEVKMKLLEEYAHQIGQTIVTFLGPRQRQGESWGERVDRVYAQVEKAQSR